MLKRFLFAMAPLMLVAGTVTADDELLSAVAMLDSDTVAEATVETDELGQADVDALMGEGEESEDEAIAACFRRYGYGYGWGNRGYYRSYSYYRPFYRSYGYGYSYPRYCYTPSYYSCYTPIYRSYWGCW